MFAVILFGRHISKSSEEHSRLGLRRFQDTRNAEIYDFNCAFPTEHYIGGLDIAMNDSAFVSIIERATRLNRVCELQ